AVQGLRALLPRARGATDRGPERRRPGAHHLRGDHQGPRRTDLGGAEHAARRRVLLLSPDRPSSARGPDRIIGGRDMSPPPNGPLVLVVEDEQPIRRFLRATLESQGYRVKEAATAIEGLLQARTHTPDLVLLDLGLPDGDGLQVTKAIRAESMMPIV